MNYSSPTFSPKNLNVRTLRELRRSSRHDSVDEPQPRTYGEGSAWLNTSSAAYLTTFRERESLPPTAAEVFFCAPPEKDLLVLARLSPPRQQRLRRYRRMECPDPRLLRTTVRARAERGWPLEPCSVSPEQVRIYLGRVSRAREIDAIA